MTPKINGYPFIIWAACFLWLTSIFTIIWSLLLFFTVGDMLLLTGTDLVNAFVLLSGIIMVPTNIHMLRAISNNNKIYHDSKVICCPFWLCVTWIIIISFVGAILCIQRIYSGQNNSDTYFHNGMNDYRTSLKYRRVVDNVQWSLKCCGLNSYTDWFKKKWFDHNLVIDVNTNHVNAREVDSVPLSCCKSGSCTSNYLTELGPNTINTQGCGVTLNRIVMVSMFAHLTMFCTVIVLELLILKFTTKGEPMERKKPHKQRNVRRIMSINNNFNLTSGSCVSHNEESDAVYIPSPASELKIDIYKHALYNGIYQDEEIGKTQE